MQVLTDDRGAEALTWLDEAARIATNALCLRAHCGAVIVKNGTLIGQGFNSPPGNKSDPNRCLAEYDIPAGFRHDRTCCIHAEQRAIADAIKSGHDLYGSSMYFVRVNEKGE